MDSLTVSNELKNTNSSNDTKSTKRGNNHIQNSISKNGGLASVDHSKYNTTDPEFWLKNIKLEFIDQLHDIFTAIIEERTTAFCTVDKQKGALYIDSAGSWVLKIYPWDKARVLNGLWENCPLYTEDCSPYDWYLRQKSEREHPARSNSQQGPIPADRKTRANEFSRRSGTCLLKHR
jgi:hypothetical protein